MEVVRGYLESIRMLRYKVVDVVRVGEVRVWGGFVSVGVVGRIF